jgi:alpha-tubulin suppressor-like RCC1 family protein
VSVGRAEQKRGVGRAGLSSMVAVASVLAAAAGILSACANDADDKVEPPTVDSGYDGDSETPDTGTDAPSGPTDAGADPDARGAYDPTDAAVVCDASPCATQLVAGELHFCARMSDSTVRCWGADSYGALGNSSPDAGTGFGTDGGTTVRDVGGLGGIVELSASYRSNCARLEDGSVQCWGANDSSQLGVKAGSPRRVPTTVPLPAEATHVELGTRYACALLSNGEQWCWGMDEYLQQLRRDGATEANYLRIFLPGRAKVGDLSFVQLALSDNTIVGVTAQGETFSWGAVGGEPGILAGRVGSITPDETPRKLPSLTNAKSVVASTVLTTYPSKSRGHACAIVDGQIYCWGRSYVSALGTGVPGQELEPALAPFPDTVKTWPQQLAVGDEITCARMTDGSIYCAGSDIRGRLSTGKPNSVNAFFTKNAAFTKRAVQVATSNESVCALVEDGTVECWGSNANGELGFPSDDKDHPTPVKVAF